MTGAETYTKKNYVNSIFGARIGTALAGAKIHSRLVVEINPNFGPEKTFILVVTMSIAIF